MSLALLIGCLDYGITAHPGDNPGGLLPPPVLSWGLDSGVAWQWQHTTENTTENTVEGAPEAIYLSTCCELLAFDPTTQQADSIGVYSLQGKALDYMTDIAIDPTGRMYGTSFSALYRIDPLTAEATWVATLPDVWLDSLTFLPDGRLVAAGEGEVWLMDIETGELQSLSHSDYTSAGDIVGLPDGLLYWSVREDNRLVVVDPKSGVAQPLDPTDYYGVYGLGYANGDLWGFSSKGHALVYDTTTGSVTESYPLSGDWWGATTNPGLWKAP